MARMLPAICPAARGGEPVGAAERLLFNRLAAELDASWTIVHDCEVRAGEEAGTIPFVLLNRDRGIALIGVAEPDEEEDPRLAIAAMRAMLQDIGFAGRFPGALPVLARTVDPAMPKDLGAFLSGWLAGERAAIADPTWPEWLVERLTPAEETARPAPRQRPPAAGPRVAETRAGTAPTGLTAERSAVSGAAGDRSSLPAGMAVAAAILAALLVGMVLFSGPSPSLP